MYAIKAKRCIRAARLQLPLRARDVLLLRHQRVRQVSGGRSRLPDCSSESNLGERRTTRTNNPAAEDHAIPLRKIAYKPLFKSTISEVDATKGEPQPSEAHASKAEKRQRREQRIGKYVAWLNTRMAEDASLESKTDLERREIYWNEVERHYLPESFSPMRIRRKIEKDTQGEAPKVVRFSNARPIQENDDNTDNDIASRLSARPLRAQRDHGVDNMAPRLSARPPRVSLPVSRALEGAVRPRISEKREPEPHRGPSCRWCGVSGHSPRDCKVFTSDVKNGLCHYTNGIIRLGRAGEGGRRLYDAKPKLGPLRDQLMRLQRAQKELEASDAKVGSGRVIPQLPYSARCSWCGSPAHTRVNCALFGEDVEDGLCHEVHGKVHVGRDGEGGAPLVVFRGLGEGTPLRNRLPRIQQPPKDMDAERRTLARDHGPRPADHVDGLETEERGGNFAPIRKIEVAVSNEMIRNSNEASSPVRYYGARPEEDVDDNAPPHPPKKETATEGREEGAPIRKIEIDPGPPRALENPLVRARESMWRRIVKRESPETEQKTGVADEADLAGDESELELPKPLYETDLCDSQIYWGAIASLKPSTLREHAIERNVPFLIRNPDSTTSFLDDLAYSSGLPAISEWFNPPPAADLTPSQAEQYTPFTPYLSSPARNEILLPYELLTPIIPTANDGTHDLLTSFIWPAHPSLAPHLPPPGTLTSLLEQCLDFLSVRPHLDQDIWYEEIARNSARRANFLGVEDGKPLNDVQWTTLQKWGPLFQTFHSFTAPLDLMVAAATPAEESESAAPSLPGLYIAQAQLADLPREMQAHVPLPKVLAELYMDAGDGRGEGRAPADIYGANLWMGTPPTFTPLHKDPNPNFFVQLRGQKVIRLLPPAVGQKIYARVQRKIAEETAGNNGALHGGSIRGEEMMQGLERVELGKAVWGGDEDVSREPALTKERVGDMVVLSPGDALYIPKGWWHSVKSMGEGLNASVNWWFR